MDLIFNEERLHLEEVEGELETIILGYGNRLSSLVNDLQDMIVCDYDDRETLMEMRADKAWLDRCLYKYTEIKKSPYFGHMELARYAIGDDQPDFDSVYIGKEGVTKDGEPVIVDWRSPVGEFFYLKNQTEFDITDYHYNLHLRRALRIENAELISYNTEYEKEGSSFKENVADPFLLAVLKDKRREYRLTDIIRTIQGNQNDIIRKQAGENFIVQGCAGSGKTMILLHRLSYLAFNNKSMNMEKVIILTPNPFFNLYINDLSEQLGLDKIERKTVDAFYESLYEQITGSSLESSALDSELSLPNSFLNDVYSESFFSSLIKRYENYWASILSSLSEFGFFDLLEECEIHAASQTIFKRYTYKDLLGNCSSIEKRLDFLKNGIKEKGKEIEKNKNKIQEIDEEILRLRAECSDFSHRIQLCIDREIKLNQSDLRKRASEKRNAERDLEAMVQLVSDSLKEDIEKTQKDIDTYEHFIEEAKRRLSDLLSKTEKIAQEIEKNANALYEWSHIEPNFLCRQREENFQFSSAEQETIDHFRRMIEYRDSLHKNLQALSVFSFTKRRALKSEYDSQSEQLCSMCRDYVAEKVTLLRNLIETETKRENDFCKQTEKQRDELNSLVQRRDELFIKKESLLHTLESYHQDSTVLSSEDCSSQTRLLILDYEKKNKDVQDFSGAIACISERLQFFVQVQSAMQRDDSLLISLLESTIERAVSFSPDEREMVREVLRKKKGIQEKQEESFELSCENQELEGKICEWNHQIELIQTFPLDSAKVQINQLDFKNVLRNTWEKELEALYHKHQFCNESKRKYRYQLFTRLLIAWLYFGKSGNLPTFINVDEAQDLSTTEYKLLRLVLGTDCVFNLYGDLKQRVYSYKGISDWSDLEETIGKSLYVLNENYRNTYQITDYCNMIFGTSIIPIGITGDVVEEMSLHDAIAYVAKMARRNNKKRIAVILSKEDVIIRDQLMEYPDTFSWGSISEGKISIITVEMSKGLEFDCVVAITNQMTENERYVSFTRALDKLIVVSR